MFFKQVMFFKFLFFIFQAMLLLAFLLPFHKKAYAENEEAENKFIEAVISLNLIKLKEAVIEYGADIETDILMKVQPPEDEGSHSKPQELKTLKAVHFFTHKNNAKLLEVAVKELGANIHAVDEDGFTPIELSFGNKILSTTKALLSLGANPNQTINNIPLFYMAILQNAVPMAKLFLSYNNLDITKTINMTVENQQSITIDSAVKLAKYFNRKEILNLIQEKQLSKKFLQAYENKNQHLLKTIVNEKNVNKIWIQTELGDFSPLQFAAQVNDLDFAKYLVEDLKANVDFGNRDGHHALYLAILNGHTDFAKFLLEKGSHVKTRSVTKMSLVHVAVLNGDEEALNLLIKYQAPMDSKSAESLNQDPIEKVIRGDKFLNSKSTEGLSPLDLAKKYKYEKLEKILEKHLKTQKPSSSLASQESSAKSNNTKKPKLRIKEVRVVKRMVKTESKETKDDKEEEKSKNTKQSFSPEKNTKQSFSPKNNCKDSFKD